MESSPTPFGYKLGRFLSSLVACLVGGLVVLLAVGLLINATRAAWWLTQEQPIVATLAVGLGLVLVGRKL